MTLYSLRKKIQKRIKQLKIIQKTDFQINKKGDVKNTFDSGRIEGSITGTELWLRDLEIEIEYFESRLAQLKKEKSTNESGWHEVSNLAITELELFLGEKE